MRSRFLILPVAVLLASMLPAMADAPLDVDPAHPPAGVEASHCTPAPGSGDYPVEARRLGQQGNAEVRYVVDEAGHVSEATLEKSTGFSSLDNASLDMVRQFQCTPATLNGKPIAVRTRFDEQWTLKGIASPTSPPPVSPGAGITPPVALTRHATTEDDYPPLARARREEGTTLVYYVVNEDGSVGETRVEKSSGFADLDAASLEMVKTWRFKPATKDGKPITVSNRVDVTWKLTAPPLDASPYFTTVHMTEADYPPAAKAAHEEGSALIVIYVDEQGHILNTQIQSSTGFADLDQATDDLAKTHWHFAAATFNGKPAGSAIALVVVWSLKPPPPDDTGKKKQ